MGRTKLVLILTFIGFLLAGCQGSNTSEKLLINKERALDRQVHVQDSVIWEIPDVPRWCDRLELENKRIDIGGCELFVEDQGSGLPIVLLHGGPGSTHHEFHPAFDHASKFARIIYYDQRGCGLSDYKPEEGYTVGQAASDLDKLREKLGIEKWVVLGHSYGGFLAQYYTTIYPDHVLGLVIVCGGTGLHDKRLRGSRQWDFIEKEETEAMRRFGDEIRRKAKEEDWSAEKTVAVEVFNNHVNGDWKRQSFYRPTMEEFALTALYGWKHDFDNYFNSRMSSSMRKFDLKGAFVNCPIPTLIIESIWDLTWVEAKPVVLHQNHSEAVMEIFSKSGHSPFKDESPKFFSILKQFIIHLPDVDDDEIVRWKEYLEKRQTRLESSLEYNLRRLGWGRKANEKIVEYYSKQQLEDVSERWLFFKLGLALYDLKNYEEALYVFRHIDEVTGSQDVNSLIWQGHMLDLLGRRGEAIAIYQQVVKMDIRDANSTTTIDTFGLKYIPSIYAEERIKSPFKRIENLRED
jgi:proline iminopeptidase